MVTAEPYPEAHGIEPAVVQRARGATEPEVRPVDSQAVQATLTSDLEKAKVDLREHGYCLVEGALAAERVRALRDRLTELAAAEITDGTDYVYEGGSNQRVWNLLNKGEIFIELALDPTGLGLVEHVLGWGFLLSNIDANLVGPGGAPMFLHADQSFVPPPWPPYSLVANIMWMLDDFTPENGATRIVPGSHTRDHGPGFGSDPFPPTVPVCAPAGTAMVFEGRLWHQTGTNVTEDQRRYGILAYYCRPFIRQQENFFASLRPEVLEDPRLRQLLGWENYLSLGMVDGMPRHGMRY
jgi:ectoine hydroxylase-related dioxygenase (phytanoyl-CoA dioxygenase family)